MKNINNCQIKKIDYLSFVNTVVSSLMFACCFSLLFGCMNNNANKVEGATDTVTNYQTSNTIDKDLTETASIITYKKNKTINNNEKKYQNLITVSLSGKERKMPVYGFNGNNTGGPAYTNKIFRDSIAALDFKVIRYPGGSVANWWDWQNGWFEKEGTQKELLKKQKLKPVSCGLKELKTLVDETKCEVDFTLNMISRDVNDQIAMLKEAESLGIPIRWIELGNEFHAPQSVAWEKFKTATGYAKTCKLWIDAIKKVFPNAKVAVVGGDLTFNEDVKNWNSIMLANAPNADALIAHLYAIPTKFIDNGGINYKKLYEECIAKFDDRGFNKVKNNIDIWITEYNVQWEAPGVVKTEALKQQYQPKAFSWSQSLAILLMTSTLTELSERTKLIINHNITNTPVFAAIESTNNTFRKLPNGIGMQIWLKASNNMTSMEKLNFSSGQGGTHISEYDLFGWQFSNGNQKKILIVNLKGNNSKVDLSSFAKSNLNFEIASSDKQTVLKTAADVKRISGTTRDGVIDMPPFSTLTITL